MRRAITLSAALAAAVLFPWVTTHFYGGTMELGDRSLFGGIGLEPGTLVLSAGRGRFTPRPGNHLGKNVPGIATVRWTVTGIDPWGNYSPHQFSYVSLNNFYIRLPIPLIFIFPAAFLPVLYVIFKRVSKKTSLES